MGRFDVKMLGQPWRMKVWVQCSRVKTLINSNQLTPSGTHSWAAALLLDGLACRYAHEKEKLQRKLAGKSDWMARRGVAGMILGQALWLRKWPVIARAAPACTSQRLRSR